MRALRAALAGWAVLMLGLTLTSSPAQAADTVQRTPTYISSGAISVHHYADFYNNGSNTTDKLKCVRVWTIDSRSFMRVRVNEATVGQENWITTADITIAPSVGATVCTTGSPWRPAGKVSAVVYTNPTTSFATRAWEYNS